MSFLKQLEQLGSPQKNVTHGPKLWVTCFTSPTGKVKVPEHGILSHESPNAPGDFLITYSL